MIKGAAEHGGGAGGDLDLLKRRNPVPALDNEMDFDESVDRRSGDIRHDYWIFEDGVEWRFEGSCTGEIAHWLKNRGRFDAGEVWDKNTANGAFLKATSKHYGKTRQQFIDWCNSASVHGTAMHKELEKFMNNCADTKSALWTSDPNVAPSLKRFLCCWAMEIDGQIVPFRTELNIWLRQCEFAGQADLIYRRIAWSGDPRKRNWLGVGDYKRSNKDLSVLRAYNDEHMLGVCNSLPATARSKFALQMTLYSLALMIRTDYVVVELVVGQFHHAHESYVWMHMEPLFSIAKAMLLDRRRRLLTKYTEQLKQRASSARRLHASKSGALDALDETHERSKNELNRYLQPQALNDAANKGNVDAMRAVGMSHIERDSRALASLLSADMRECDAEQDASVFAREIDRAIAKYKRAMRYLAKEKAAQKGKSKKRKVGDTE